MELAQAVNRLKCQSASEFKNESIENSYMVEPCIPSDDRDFIIKRNSLLIDLVENIQYLNWCGKTNCDLRKIKELHA